MFSAGAESWRSRLQAGLQEDLSWLFSNETVPPADISLQRHTRNIPHLWPSIQLPFGPFIRLSIRPSTQWIFPLLSLHTFIFHRDKVMCVTSPNAVLYICLRVGALLINKFRCVGRRAYRYCRCSWSDEWSATLITQCAEMTSGIVMDEQWRQEGSGLITFLVVNGTRWQSECVWGL